MRSMTARPLARSRLPVGSSARTIAGLMTSARAIATRCCSPPESVVGWCLARWAILTDLERLGDPRVDLALRHVVEHERHADVLLGGEEGQEIEGLQHVADAAAAELGGFLAAHLGDVVAFDQDGAAGRRREAGDQVQDGALAGAARAHERPEVAAFDREGEVVDGLDGGVAGAEDLGDVAVLDHAVPATPYRSASRLATSSSQVSSARAESSAPSIRRWVTKASKGARRILRRSVPSLWSSCM